MQAKDPDHEWPATALDRTNGHGCPYCSGNRFHVSNSLANKFPEIAKEWHPTKNEELTPYDFTSGSGKKVWWKCTKGDDHEWQAAIFSRVDGVSCPICSGNKIVLSNCLDTTHGILVKEWHPTLNKNITPNNIGKGSHKKDW